MTSGILELVISFLNVTRPQVEGALATKSISDPITGDHEVNTYLIRLTPDVLFTCSHATSWYPVLGSLIYFVASGGHVSSGESHDTVFYMTVF